MGASSIPCFTSGAVSAHFSSVASVPLVEAGYSAAGETVELTLGFTPVTGSNLTVVNNTGAAFIQGEFSNLAQGQEVVLKNPDGLGFRFVANYYGGSGNDLVLHWAANRLVNWGYNSNYQLGNNTTTNSKVPLAVSASGVLAGKTVLQVAVGAYHTLVLCSDGTLITWGILNNQTEQTPVVVALTGALAGKRVVAVAAGLNHSLALCSDGTVASWGANAHGQLGNGNHMPATAPVGVSTGGVLAGKSVTAISAAWDHNVALCSDGTVVTWGWNSNGQLGDGSVISRNAPVAVVTTGVLADRNVKSVHAGGRHSAVLCTDGTVVSWGWNAFGQLGVVGMSESSVPVAVNATSGALAGRTVKDLAVGDDHNLARCSDGTWAGWGGNFSRELANAVSPFTSTPVPVEMTGALSGKTLASVSAGDMHSIGLCSDGTLVAWGYNFAGQLGNGMSTLSIVPNPVLVNKTILTAGERFARSFSGASFGSHFNVALVAAPVLAPEIVVEQPTSAALVDGAGAVDFGNVTVGAAAGKTLTFTIRNRGTLPLTGLNVSKEGSESGAFTVSSLLATPLAAGGMRTFTVKFVPSGAGAHTALLHIASNDSDEAPFDIALTGSGFAKPSVVTAPISPGFLEEGVPLDLEVDAGGSGILSYQWYRNGVAISGANAASFNVPAVTLANAGSYTVKVTNSAGNVTSAAANVGVINSADSSPVINEGLTLNLTAPVSGPALAYQWFKGAHALVADSRISGVNAAKLGIKNANATDTAAYACAVTMGGATASTGTFNATVFLKPVMSAVGTQSFVVSETVALQMTAQNSPVKFAATGLPMGLAFNTTTGMISGKPMKAGAFNVKFTASNPAGMGPATFVTFNIVPLPSNVVGAFSGLVERGTDLSLDSTQFLSGHGGAIKFSVAATGALSGTLKLEAKSHAFTGVLNTGASSSPHALVTIKRGTDASVLTLDVTIDPANGYVSGGIIDGAASATVDAAPMPWSAANPASALAGVYNSALELPGALAGNPVFPQGNGYGILTVSTSGVASWAGRMADGTAVTASSTIGAQGGVPLFAMLYTPMAPATAGSVNGWVQVSNTGGSNVLDGLLSWFKRPQAAGSTTRSYKAGFASHTLAVTGGIYVPPASGMIALGLPNTPENAMLSFMEAGLASPLSLVFTLNDLGKAVLPTMNPNKVTVTSFNTTTGVFYGSVTVSEVSGSSPTLVSRKGDYYGLLVPRLGKGAGYVNLVQMPTPPETLMTSPILSGQVLLEPSP